MITNDYKIANNYIMKILIKELKCSAIEKAWTWRISWIPISVFVLMIWDHMVNSILFVRQLLSTYVRIGIINWRHKGYRLGRIIVILPHMNRYSIDLAIFVRHDRHHYFTLFIIFILNSGNSSGFLTLSMLPINVNVLYRLKFVKKIF